MRKLVFAINMSLDGYADHELGIADDELHAFFVDEVLEKTDLLLFGRKTYQLMEAYWPKAPDDPEASPTIIRFAEKFNAMPKIVFSGTLQEAAWNNSKLVKTDAMEEIRKLKQTSGGVISVGGISLIQECIRSGLIDEFTILVHPVLWGKGRRFFENVDIRQNMVLLETKKFKSGVVVMKYGTANQKAAKT
jgi:dihydrofolate reductase